jgi:hypothetical protein
MMPDVPVTPVVPPTVTPTVTPYSLLDRLKEFSSAEGAVLIAAAPFIRTLLPDNVWTALIPIVMAAIGAAKILYPANASNATVQTIITDADTLATALQKAPSTTIVTGPPS